ncbi:hypothetical protein [Nostoc sp.]|uniref:hypothetical protein n=1 Tax=Nostoc sp. TaxID=1180 RepID=UPI002FF8FFEE
MWHKTQQRPIFFLPAPCPRILWLYYRRRKADAAVDSRPASLFSGTHGQEFVLVDCNTALNLALNNLHVAIAQSKAIITHEPLPKFYADKTQMVQLFQNLIGNAIKFCRKEPPRIHIGTILRKAGEAEEKPNSSLLTPHSPVPSPHSPLRMAHLGTR